jgi:glycosyltransferase involved in cell wall biosynthesis
MTDRTITEEPGAAPPAVSVIVPHFEDLRALDLCLGALGRQTVSPRTFEVIVADNNSPVGRAKLEALIGNRARLVVVEEKGAGPARNGGVRAARGAILAFTDCDCLPEPEWLEEGVKALRDYDLVGGRMTVLVADPASMTPEEAFERLFAFDNERYVKTLGFTVTANLFCSRATFDEVGDFVGGAVSEDTEWCLRAKGMGKVIGYAEKSVVGHPARRTGPELLSKWRRINSGNYGVEILRRGGRVKWLLKSLLLPASALAHTPKALFGSGVSTLGQRFSALRVLYRMRLWRTGDSLRLLTERRQR